MILETVYGHLSKQLVEENQLVKAGEVIGVIDKSKIPKIKKDYMDRCHIQSNNEQIYYHTKRTGIFNSKEQMEKEK